MNLPNDAYRIVDHTADWALAVRGRDLPGLFRHAALGMAFLLAGDVSDFVPDEERGLTLESVDAEELLVAWLNELAYWAERDRLICTDFHLRHLSPTSLEAVVRGSRVPELQKHIKAVTFNDLVIRETDEGLEVTVVFDV